MQKFVNLTPHDIRLNDGTVYPPDGTVARVETVYGQPDRDGIVNVYFGQTIGLPAPAPGVFWIVSGMVAEAARQMGRKDCVCPATGHPDAKRNDKGQIVSVPFLSRPV